MIGACVRKLQVLLTPVKQYLFLCLQYSYENHVFRAGWCGVGTAGLDHWRPARGDRRCFHSWRAFRPVDGVGAPAATLLVI